MPPNFNTNDSFYNTIYDGYNSLFTENEKENITLLLLSEEDTPFKYHQTLAHFYQSSKIFTLLAIEKENQRSYMKPYSAGFQLL